MKTIAERIKERRIELNISQLELAHKLGYKNKTSVTNIELGKQQLTQSKIMAIAKALETTPSFIMGWDEEQMEQTEKEKLIDGYNELSPDKREMLMNYLTFLLQK